MKTGSNGDAVGPRAARPHARTDKTTALPTARPCTFLELRGISKRFGGVRALSRRRFRPRRGRDPLPGRRERLRQIDAHQDHLRRAGARSRRPHRRRGPGASAPHARREQRARHPGDLPGSVAVPESTVAENIAIGRHRELTGLVQLVGGAGRWRRRRCSASTSTLDLDEKVSHLSIANRQLVAICRAIAADAKLVIMDEPTASLTRHEVDSLLALALELKRATSASVRQPSLRRGAGNRRARHGGAGRREARHLRRQRA